MKTKTLKYLGPTVLFIYSLFTLVILYLIIEIRLSKYAYHQKVNYRDFEVGLEISKLRFKIHNYRLSTMLNYLQIIQNHIYSESKFKNHEINQNFWIYIKNASLPHGYYNKIFNASTIIESFSLFHPIILYFNQIPFAMISLTKAFSEVNSFIPKLQYKNETISEAIKVDEKNYNLLCNNGQSFSICYAFIFYLNQTEFISKQFDSVYHNNNKNDIIESEYQQAKYLFYKQEKSEFKEKYSKMLKNNKNFSSFYSNQKGRQK